ncbi:RNase HII [Pseudobutyrivibrio sp. C4]|uniref:ribonuclease HII n=1 Tax=Pseudobutyrivibrio sp. C4 TaxID=1520803 RepID=UPI0008C1C80E|nr:ribonuclease HII [Pseudobutyrivibrio sp. C4]SES72460.1 RNase HII [Pseudobutyrivibrio sp. C4]
MSEKKISEIQKEYKETSELLLPDFIEEYINDGRPGVSKIIGMAQKRMEKLRIERERIEHLKEFENQYWPEFDYIGGIDEVGRGPLAGPVVTACVVLPKDCSILYINDSKKLSASKRDELYEIIMKEAVSVGIGVCSEQRIDEINILQATYEAMRQAISECSVEPQVLLNDAVTIPEVKIKQVPIIKGDAKSISIGAASIIAKVTRDRMMVEYDSIYPEYHFASNKGYGSAEHIEAIKKYGPCPIHRRSFIGNFV